MTRTRSFWLFGLLSASCVVNGFTIEDRLPGGGGSAGAGVAGSSAGGTPSGAGTSSQGGEGTSGAVAQGGKAGTAGSQGNAGSAVADAGEPSVGQGGEGGAPSGSTAPCAPGTDGASPLLCDDFESGGFNAQKWMPPAGLGVTTAAGPSGNTKLVHLDAAPLATQLTDLPLPDAGGEVTVSFWVRVVTESAGSPIVTFRDRSAVGNTLRLNVIMNELGWRSSGSNFWVPQAATGATFSINVWTCVSIHLTARSIVLSYQSVGVPIVNTLTIDETATAGVDQNWQMMAADARFVAGYPAFGGTLNGTSNSMDVDDVRIAADTSSVCPF